MSSIPRQTTYHNINVSFMENIMSRSLKKFPLASRKSDKGWKKLYNQSHRVNNKLILKNYIDYDNLILKHIQQFYDEYDYRKFRCNYYFDSFYQSYDEYLREISKVLRK
jgi:hypothetical protein